MATKKEVRLFTTNQMGDACEMLIATELTLAGVPAAKMPDNWPDYDIVAQPANLPSQRISVKSRTFKRGGDRFVDYDLRCSFDWLAAVLLPGDGQEQRRTFLIPKAHADANAPKRITKKPWDIYWRHDAFVKTFADYEDNFELSPTGRKAVTPVNT
ncbi:MAG: hypothetical protein ABI147_13925 [Acidobacteriaceae bacterium]